MNSQNSLKLLGSIILLFVFTILILTQSLIYQKTQLIQAPLWTLLVTYIVLHRSFWGGIIYSYLFAFLLMHFSAMSWGIALCCCILMSLLIHQVKKGLHWPQFGFYFLVCILIGLAYPIIYWGLSSLAFNEWSSLSFFSLIWGILFTLFVSYPLYLFFKYVDHLFFKNRNDYEMDY